jgi:hypothetical protein
MERMTKLSNANYLHDVPAQCFAVNETNRLYIDRFINENYQRLSDKFTLLDGTINSSAFGAMDKLNETIVSLYTDPNLCFSNWKEADNYLTSKFTEKAIRVVVKKPTKPDEEDRESWEEL